MAQKNISWDQIKNELILLSTSDPKLVNFTDLHNKLFELKKQINLSSLVSVDNPNFELNKCYYGDAIELSKTVPDNFVDLVITSPPYADMVSYGDSVQIYGNNTYVDWIMPLILQIGRFLKPSGSFILNINDKITNKTRDTYVLELVVRITKETNLQLFDRYIWYKKGAIPTGGEKRLNDRIEYIFHFIKDKDAYVAYTDNVRIPYKETTLRRYKSPVKRNDVVKSDGTTSDGHERIDTPNNLGTKPYGVFRFDTRASMKGGKHPAPFHPQLPEWFIQWLTKPNDIVLDPFLGCGTTAHAAMVLNRRWIGFEINETYKKFIDDIATSYPNNKIIPYINEKRVHD